MPEEATETPASQDTSPDDAPVQTDTAQESTDSEPDVNWERRYADLQPEYTRATQEASELRQQQEQLRTALVIAQDPEHPDYVRANEMLGFEVEDSEDEYESDEDALQQRLDQLEERFEQSDQEAEMAALEDAEWTWLDRELGRLEADKGLNLSDEEAYVVVGAALANRLDNDQPDMEGAFEALTKAWDSRQKAWRESKRAPQAPSGATAASDVNLDDKESRREFMLRRSQDLEL